MRVRQPYPKHDGLDSKAHKEQMKLYPLMGVGIIVRQ